MKRIVLLISAALILFGGSIASAQGKYGADSAECIKYLSYYAEYYKQKNYDEALPNWRKAYKLCPPTANQTMLVNGQTLMRQQITKNANNATYKAALIDTLMTLHDTRAQYYPKAAVTARNNKALDIINYIKDDNKYVYNELSSIAAANGTETKTNVYLFIVNSSIALHESGDMGTEGVIEEYEKAMAALDAIAEAKPNEDITKVRSDIENLFISSNIASCENLIELFTPRLEADPNNYETAATIAKIMGSVEGCTDNDLFVNAVATMHKLQPSAQSAYLLYRLYASQGDVDKAGAVMAEAINSDETDAETDANYYFELASFYLKSGANAKAYDAARKSAELDADGDIKGKAYLLIGTVWGSTVCKGNEIEQRAPYWVAVDYMQRAKAADPSIEDECNKYIAQYRAYYPQAADAFMYDVTEGQSYTVSCNGMTAVTTVKTQK